MKADPNCTRCGGRGWYLCDRVGDAVYCECTIERTPPREHWSVEQVKRLVIQAITNHSQGVGMAVSARVAADQIIDLLVPDANHRHMPLPCTCPSSLADDAYEPGGPMSGRQRPLCLLHTRNKAQSK